MQSVAVLIIRTCLIPVREYRIPYPEPVYNKEEPTVSVPIKQCRRTGPGLGQLPVFVQTKCAILKK